MKYKGRNIDPVRFWEQYVDFPTHMPDSGFAPLVFCPNPDHDNTQSPAFQVNLDEPLVHCFSHCGISGTYQHAICVIEGLYGKAQVSSAPNQQERRRRIAKAMRQANKILLGKSYFDRQLPPGKQKPDRTARKKNRLKKALEYETWIPPLAADYLHERGISEDSIARWEIGWDAENLRIVIPAKDLSGTTRLLIKRSIREKDRPKYLYTEGVPKTSLLFGACNLDLGCVRSDGMILEEGAIDTIRLHQHGLRNACGILGTGISEQQVRIVERVRPPRIFLMFDKDLSGVTNIEIAARMLVGFPLYVCRYPGHRSDPAQFTKEEAYRSMERAIPYLKFKQVVRKTSLNATTKERSSVG
jgi:DNA primase